MRTRLVDGRAITLCPAQRRLAMRAIFRLATNTHLLAVSLVDSHLHLLGAYSVKAGSRLLHAVEASLKQCLSLPVSFAMYPHEPVRTAQHLRNGFRYTLNQHEHHGVQTDPLREGSNLHDLLGLRLAGDATRVNVRRWLPRVTRHQLLGWLGVASLEPANGPLEWVHDATLSAACLPSLTGKSARVRHARRAALEVVEPRCSSAELVDVLQTSQRAIQRLRHQPVDQRLAHAIRLQLGLRAQLALREPAVR